MMKRTLSEIDLLHMTADYHSRDKNGQNINIMIDCPITMK